MTRNYELTILIASALIQEEASDVQKTLTSFILEKEGGIIESSNPVKRILGYEIEKNSQAYFAEIVFSLDPSLIVDIEKKIKEDKNIIRHMLLIKHPKPKEKIKRTAPSKILEKIVSKPFEQVRSRKVALGDIDKKIDEILSE